MKTYVLYHAACWDGFCAAWVARSVLKGEVEYIPVQYGQGPPQIEPKSRLYILDFSYSQDQLFKWWTPGPNAVEHLVVLDHHKTAQAALADFDKVCVANGLDVPKIVFDMNKSGGRLAWEHFYLKSEIMMPWLVKYTEDRDLWRWAIPHSKAVNAWLRSYPLDFKLWDELSKCNPLAFDGLRFPVGEGEAILRREQQIIDDHLRHAREIEIDGHKVLAVNATVLFSEIAGELAKDRPFGACYFDKADGKRQWSLRSRDGGVDVSEVAKKFGGGGHRQAAGYEQ